jgi:hypothetical protein
MTTICGVVCNCGPNLEPLACGYKPGHVGPHAWATLPTFTSPPGPEPRPCRVRNAGYGVGGTMGRSFPFDQPRGGYPYRRD